MTGVAELSDRLHDRVRSFKEHPLTTDFEALALDIAAFQAEHVPGFGRLVRARGAPLADLDSIPAVPVEAFRLTRIAAHPPELDVARFVTSGTTSSVSGVHAFRTTRTYRELAVEMARRALASAMPGPRVVVALAAEPGEVPTSSLGFMMRALMEEWDGRSFRGTPFDVRAEERWLVGPNGIHLEPLRSAARIALERDEPLLVLATGFSLVLLLDALAGGTVEAPERTVIMPTGGFKGRTRAIDEGELVASLARAFRIDPRHVVGEYGMTELSSQLYEGTLPGGELEGPRGVFLEPPWLRVTPVSAVDLTPVPDGEEGLARIVDLGNVDSAVAIVTQDVVRRRGGGIELCGRAQGAPPRGCSLAVEEMVLASHSRGIRERRRESSPGGHS